MLSSITTASCRCLAGGNWRRGFRGSWTKSAWTTAPAKPSPPISKGMLQRLALAQALVNDPELLVLDEPTEGMDLSARKLLHEIILRRKAEGKTAILVSHSMADVGRLCDEVAVLRGGQVVFHGGLADLPAKGREASDADTLQEALEPIYAGAAS